MKAYSPIRNQQEQEGKPLDHNYEETASFSGNCGCFKLFCFDGLHNRDVQSRGLLQEKTDHKETWLVKKLKEVKEASEMIAGPKWKNLMRKISKNLNTKKQKCQYQYDPESYRLNFDHGVVHHEEEDGMLLDFSSRFASPVSSNNHKKPTGL